jgi:biotin synthase
MTTAGYPFGLFLEISGEIRWALNERTTLIANVGDQSLADARIPAFAGMTMLTYICCRSNKYK